MGRPIGSKNKAVEAFRTNEILTSVSGLTLDNVSNKLAAVQVEVQHTLAGLSTKLTEQLAVLGNVENAILLKKEELKQLHGIEATAVTMDDLTAQIELQREEWVKEQNKNAELAQLTLAQRQQQWAREEEQYGYRRAQERQKTEDAFTAKMTLLDKQARDTQEKREKDWAEREGNLKSREQELVDLKNQVASFPATLKTEMDRASNIAKHQVTSDYETKIKIATAESNTNQKLAAQEIQSLNKTIGELNNQVVGLRTQLERAHEDIKIISQKALESAASRETVANLQRAFESVQTSKGSK